jgi:hypothetical protein
MDGEELELSLERIALAITEQTDTTAGCCHVHVLNVYMPARLIKPVAPSSP